MLARVVAKRFGGAPDYRQHPYPTDALLVMWR